MQQRPLFRLEQGPLHCYEPLSGVVGAVLDLVGHLGNEGIQLHRGGLALAVTHRDVAGLGFLGTCLLYTSPSPRDRQKSRMPSSA